MKTIGYARTTIPDNDLNTQIRILSDYGCDDIHHETLDISNDGGSIASELETVINGLEAEDALVISRLNHLGRSTRQLTELTQHFKKHGIHLISLHEGIDTRQPMGDIYFNLLDGLAMMECDLLKERTLIGLNKARKKGKIGGRPKIDGRIVKKIRHLYYEKKETIQFISSKCSVSVGTCYKYINLSDSDIAKLCT